MSRVLGLCLKPLVVAAIVLIAVLGLLKVSGQTGDPTALANPAPAAVAQEVETTENIATATADPGGDPPPDLGQDPLILSYPAKFVCQEPLRPGQLYYGLYPPVVKESTNVLIHNPNAYAVTFYRKAVQARLTDQQPIAPTGWYSITLQPDHAIRFTCDDVARMLTNVPTATFAGAYPLGTEVEGYLVAAVGPQAGVAQPQFGTLDVTAEYVRGSEELKKDIVHENWWWWWWWPLPWQLGKPYERIIPISPTQNIDCYGSLANVLAQDVQNVILDPTTRQWTLQALQNGQNYNPIGMGCFTTQITPSIVIKIGKCDKIDTTHMQVDYVLVSNKGPLDPDPRVAGAQPSAFAFPWTPGRLYDLNVVMPQNYDTDMYVYLREWYTVRWIETGRPEQTVRSAMSYYFPYWCGWGYWAWWWNGEDCLDIGAGEGESLDVERITPSRVFMASWPPRTL